MSGFNTASPLPRTFEGFTENWEDDPDFVGRFDEADPSWSAPWPPHKPVPPGQVPQGSWKYRLGQLLHAMASESAEPPARALEQEILYILDVPPTLVGQGLAVDLACRRRKANGEWGVAKPLRI